MELLWDVIKDTLLDGVRLLPFLFAAFLLLEAIEHHTTKMVERVMHKIEKAGPLVGAFFGCIPQCGFSVMASNLFAGGVISLGTLLAVFLATSDEAILILLANPGQGGAIGKLILVKVIIAIVAGYAVDLLGRKSATPPKDIADMCDHCGCHENTGILKPALIHTLQIFGYVLLFSGILNLCVEFFGLEAISKVLLQGSIFQPFLAAIVGFVPNCAASILLTELYLGGTLSFASVIAGLCTNAGAGLIVLFKVNKNVKENFKIVGILYLVAVLSGVVLGVLGI